MPDTRLCKRCLPRSVNIRVIYLIYVSSSHNPNTFVPDEGSPFTHTLMRGEENGPRDDAPSETRRRPGPHEGRGSLSRAPKNPPLSLPKQHVRVKPAPDHGTLACAQERLAELRALGKSKRASALAAMPDDVTPNIAQP